MMRTGGWKLRIGTLLCVGAAMFGTGCAQDVAVPDSRAPKTAAAAPAPSAMVPGAEQPVTGTVGTDLDPALRMTETSNAAPVPDASCTVDADCEVKDIGNCCGRMPACVNRSVQPDPAAVQRECQRTGSSSICGFQELAGCRCEAARCMGVPSASGGGEVR